MQKIKQLYRTDYHGEDVNVEAIYKDAEWSYVKEFIANPIDFKPLSSRAVVIGNGTSRLDFDIKNFLPFHTGPLDTQWWPQYGRKNFYTYGCNALYREYAPDFLIATGKEIVAEIAASGYADERIVYANASELSDYPGKFQFIPQDPQYNSGALAAYLAAFDGHKKIFLIGFDSNDTPGYNYNVYAGTPGYPGTYTDILEDYWCRSLAIIFNTYPDVEFVRVSPTVGFRVPEIWKYYKNFRSITFRQFIIECDI